MLFLVTNNERLPDDNDEQEIRRLVKLACEGRNDAFEDIVFRFRESVYATAWQLTRNTEDALDVTQEAFLRAYRALNSYKGRSRFSTWLHRIVLNTGIDYLRRERRHNHISTDQNDDDYNSYSDKQENATPATQRDIIYETELQRRVMTALNQLSARQRQVFILRYYHDLDTTETAEVMKCTQGSVKRHLFRAQKRLKELLEDLRMPDDRK